MSASSVAKNLLKINNHTPMLANILISNEVSPLRTSDTGIHALQMMEEYRVNHLPIVSDTSLLALVSEDDIMDYENPEEALGAMPLLHSRPYVKDYQHILEVFRVMYLQKLTLLPVINKNEGYLGCITLTDLMMNLGNYDLFQNPGGIIALEINTRDYSPSEITRIVESNNAMLLGLLTNSLPDTTKMTVTIKINHLDITPILQTFYRFNYTVAASFGQNDYNDILRDRYDSLMNFLNI